MLPPVEEPEELGLALVLVLAVTPREVLELALVACDEELEELVLELVLEVEVAWELELVLVLVLVLVEPEVVIVV